MATKRLIAMFGALCIILLCSTTLLTIIISDKNSQIKKLTKQNNQLTVQLQTIEAQYTQLLNNYNNLLKEYSKLEIDLNSLNNTYRLLLQNYTSLETEYQKVLTEYIELTVSYARLNETYMELKDELRNYENQYRQLSQQYQRLLSNYTQLKTEYEKLYFAVYVPLLSNETVTPTIDELQQWLREDDTDKLNYSKWDFVCGDFAVMLAIHAKLRHWDMGIVAVLGQDSNGNDFNHAFNAIRCQEGIVYIEPQNDEIFYGPIIEGEWYNHPGFGDVYVQIFIIVVLYQPPL